MGSVIQRVEGRVKFLCFEIDFLIECQLSCSNLLFLTNHLMTQILTRSGLRFNEKVFNELKLFVSLRIKQTKSNFCPLEIVESAHCPPLPTHCFNS